MTLLIFGLLNPRLISAAIASLVLSLLSVLMNSSELYSSSLLNLSLSSSMSLCALFKPIPFTDLSLVTSSQRMASLSSEGEREDNIILAEDAPIPDTEVIFLNKALSSSEEKP